MYYVYVLENQNDKSLYIGMTTNLERRLKQHSTGYGGRTTSLKRDLPRGEVFRGWKLIYYEFYLIKEDAIGREKFLKGGSGRKYLKKQLRHYFGL